jgi:branched-chain amino acid transport system substrate-binding protein
VIGGVTGTNTSPDAGIPLYKKYVAQAVKYYPKLGAGAASSLFSANYWVNTWPAIQALKTVKGDLSGGQKKYRAALNALGKKGLNTPQGFIKLDQNRQAIGNNYLIKLVKLPGTYKTLRTIPKVSQSFDGFFTTSTPTPSRNSPACVKKKPPSWVGNYNAGPPKR